MLYEIDGKKQDNVSFGNKAEISEMRLPRRVQPIHYGVNYHKDPLQFKLVFGAEEPLDRHDLEEIAFWLTGHQTYQWLSICQEDMKDIAYRCMIRDLTPISIGWLPVALEATVICDCPYAYGPKLQASYVVNNSANVSFYNVGTAREYLFPALTFTPSGISGTVDWRIVNHDDGDREFKIQDIPAAGSIVTVDCRNSIITETAHHINLYGGYNMQMFRLVPGLNRLTVYGSGTTTIGAYPLHNVSA